MKTYLFSFLLIIAGYGIAAQIVNIPDPVFKQRLIDEGIDLNFDGEIQVTEAEAVNGFLDVNGQFSDIFDLTGIEAFVNLKVLHVYLNQLTTLDLSNNTALEILWCFDNQLSILDLNNNTALEVLLCGYNNLTSLNFTNCSNLKILLCGENDLSNLNLTSNSLLEEVNLSQNQLIFLDVRNGNNTAITSFTSSSNPDLTCIFVEDPVFSEENWARDPTSTFVETQQECDVLGLPEITKLQVNLFPNPVREQLTIVFNNFTKGARVKLYDLNGKIVLNFKLLKNETPIDVSHLHSGLYLLKIKQDFSNNNISTFKIIKL